MAGAQVLKYPCSLIFTVVSAGPPKKLVLPKCPLVVELASAGGNPDTIIIT